jgi:hypothetical protein
MTTWLPSIPLPSDWPAHAQLALLRAIALAHFGLTHMRGLGVPPRAPPRLPLSELPTTVAAWPAAAPSPPGAVLARERGAGRLRALIACRELDAVSQGTASQKHRGASALVHAEESRNLLENGLPQSRAA